MRRRATSLWALLLLAMVYSCQGSVENREAPHAAGLEKTLDGSDADAQQDLVVQERKIIKQGEIAFATSNAEETRGMIARNVAEFRGYISEDRVFDHRDRVEYRVTIRVPVENFEPLLDRISEHAGKLESRNITAQDVTGEFIDVQARVKTKKELEDRYKELLAQANKVEEMLAIEKEIAALRTEIESVEGRLNYLKDRVALSTLTVTFHEQASSSFGFGSKFGQAVGNGWTNLLWFFIALTNLWPFLLVGLMAFVVYRRQHKRRKAKG